MNRSFSGLLRYSSVNDWLGEYPETTSLHPVPWRMFVTQAETWEQFSNCPNWKKKKFFFCALLGKQKQNWNPLQAVWTIQTKKSIFKPAYNSLISAAVFSRLFSPLPSLVPANLILNVRIPFLPESLVLDVKLSPNIQVAWAVWSSYASERHWTRGTIRWSSLQQELHSTETWSWP